MSFAPGQIITAQRLNRLQPKTYFSQASGAISTVGSGDVTGTAMSITTETNGATAAFTWSGAFYGVTGAMASNANTRVQWDVNASPTFALVQHSAAADKGVAANVWSTVIPTAGTYTFKMIYVVATNSVLQIYSAMMVTITEVA
jgi:hypothetical protein